MKGYVCIKCGIATALPLYIKATTRSELGDTHCIGCAEHKLGRFLDDRDWLATQGELRAGLKEALAMLDEAGWSDEAKRIRLHALLKT